MYKFWPLQIKIYLIPTLLFIINSIHMLSCFILPHRSQMFYQNLSLVLLSVYQFGEFLLDFILAS